MGQGDDMVVRVDEVLDRNRRIEYMLIGFTAVLFLVGIAALVKALVSGQYVWTLPSAATTFFLRWPIEHIRNIRRSNIALAMAPVLIRSLPPQQAAEEIQKLLENLFKDGV